MARKFTAKFQATEILDRLMERERRKGRKQGRREGASYRHRLEDGIRRQDNAIQRAIDALEDGDTEVAQIILEPFGEYVAQPFITPIEARTWWVKGADHANQTGADHIAESA